MLSTFLIKLYSDTRALSSRGPLTLTVRATAIALACGYCLTWLSYFAFNKAIEHAVMREMSAGLGMPSELVKRPAASCDKLISRDKAKDRAAAQFACWLAQRADPIRFDSYELPNHRQRLELVTRLAALWISSDQSSIALNTESLGRFVGEIHLVNPSGPRVPLKALFAYESGTADQAQRKANLAAALEMVVTGLDRSEVSYWKHATGMRSYSPDMYGVERFLFQEPQSADPSERPFRLDALALVEGLVDELKKETFWTWRIAQAVNGLIQWLTLLTAWTCAVLLLMRRRWATLNIQILERYIGAGQVPIAMSPTSAFGQRSKWIAATEMAQDLKRNRAFLPWRVLRDGMKETADGEALSPSTVVKVAEDYSADTIDHDYALVNWLVEAIPTLGFLGTIYGMILAMGGAGSVVGAQTQQALKLSMGELSRNLGTAFDTTAVALVLAMAVGLLRASTRRSETEMFVLLRESSELLVRQGRSDHAI